MWFPPRKKQDAKVKAIHKATFDSIDRATKSIEKNTASLDKLNKLLEEKGDTAYNIFNATGGPRRQQK